MKKILLIASLILLSVQLYAERIDRSTALKIANTIINKADLNEAATRNYNNLYIFSSDNSFVIVAADDRVKPIIGYSNDNPFAIEKVSSNIAYWLDKANGEIQYAIDNDMQATDEIRNEWHKLVNGIKPDAKSRAGVEALMTTKWSQDSPFSNMCPNGTYTGCAATAMAQVMKYWNWPVKGIGSHTYYEDNFGEITADFGNTIYDWDNMKDVYYNSSPTVEKNAVATLMFHCGVSIDMDYGYTASGAFPDDVPSALVKYFDYSNSTCDRYKPNYSDSQWLNILKTELNASRPIIYNGWDINGGGHSFVCDGYDEYDNFHFNWGWEGYCDGYYAIGALNPGVGGIGSGSGKYNENNYIIIGIKPNYNYSNTLFLTTETYGYEPIVDLSWVSYYSADSFNIYRTLNGNTSLIANVSGTTFSYTDTNLEYGKEYCYTVKNVVGGVEKDESNQSCITIVLNDCYAPTNIEADVTENAPDYNMKFKIDITWDAMNKAERYVIYANGNKYKEVTENSCIIGTNKETVIELSIKTVCNDGFESNTSEPITIVVEHNGIEEHESYFEVYPNPADDKLFISTDLAIEEVNIFNITGVMVYSNSNVSDNHIDVSNLNKGIYLISIKTADGNTVKRFIKK